MPASLPPNIKFYTVVNETETLTELLDFGTAEPITQELELGPITLRIYNELDPMESETYATALSPICYVGGDDAEIVGSEENTWVHIKNIDDNGVGVIDDFTEVTHNNMTGYKALAGLEVAPDTYVTLETTLTVPAGTSGGIYDWEYVIEYMYTT